MPDSHALKLGLFPFASKPLAWQETTCACLAKAARRNRPSFQVSKNEVRKKLLDAPRLAIAETNGQAYGFVATTPLLKLPDCDLSVRYIAGTIIAPELQGQGFFSKLLNSIGPRADIECLHTQHPAMAKALTRGRSGSFPSSDWNYRLDELTAARLRQVVPRIRKRPDFDTTTGIVLNMYPHCLYGEWPLQTRSRNRSFSQIGPTDAVLVISFATPRIAQDALIAVSEWEVA